MREAKNNLNLQPSTLNPLMNPSYPYDLIIGLDRSDKKADLCLITTATGQRRSQTIDTAPEALWEWLLALRQKHPQARVGLCLEQPAVHLVAFLEAYDWITLYPINPITLQKYREAFVTSCAKDDAKDADYLADLLLTHHAKLKPWAPEDSATRAVQQLVFHRRAVVDERTGLTNRLIALLKQYFPQALVLCGEDLWRPLATRFLLKWSSLQAVQKVKPATLKTFYYLHGSRSAKLLEQRLALVQKAVPVTDETALIESFALRVQLICRQLQLVQQTLTHYEKQIVSAYAAHPDHEIFASLPGAGPVLGPRLLASIGSQRERFGAAAELQHYTGIAPVTKRSGGSCYIHRRYLCPKVPQAELPRVCQGKHSVEPMGGGVLFAAAYQGQSASDRGAGLGLQVAAGDLPLLAESHSLSGSHLRGGFEEKWQQLGVALRPRGIGQKSLQKSHERILKKPLTDYLRGELRHAGPNDVNPVKVRGPTGLYARAAELACPP